MIPWAEIIIGTIIGLVIAIVIIAVTKARLTGEAPPDQGESE